MIEDQFSPHYFKKGGMPLHFPAKMTTAAATPKKCRPEIYL
jgi:hypothetical protein